MFHFWFNTFFVADMAESVQSNGSKSQTSRTGGQQGGNSCSSNNNTCWDKTSPDTCGTGGFTPQWQNQSGRCKSQSTSHSHNNRRLRTPTDSPHEHLAAGSSVGASCDRPHHSSSSRPTGVTMSTSMSGISSSGQASPHTPSSLPLTRSTHQLSSPMENPQCYKKLILHKSELDKANKDKQHKIFNKDFKVSLILCLLVVTILYKTS